METSHAIHDGPAPHRPPTRHTIAIRQVHRLLEGARRTGADIDAILQRARISPELLTSDTARVTESQFAALIRALTHRLRDEFWATTSRPVRPGTFSLTCEAMVLCSTLEQALDLGVRQYRLALADFSPRFTRGPELAHLWLEEHAEAGPRLSIARSSFMLFGYALACWLVGSRLPLAKVDFAIPRPSNHDDMELLFEAPIRYGEASTGLWFESRWLKSAIVQDPYSLKGFLTGSPANLIVRYRDRRSIGERTRGELRRRLADDMPLERVAEALGIGPQMLSRRLKEAGQNFRALKQELRRDVAIEYLQQTGLTLEQIAEKLGFSEVSTFHRAFKDWTGVPPGAYRLSLAKPPA